MCFFERHNLKFTFIIGNALIFMKKKILSIVVALCALIKLCGQGNVYYQTNFDDGIPESFTLIDNDETPIKATVYQNVGLNGSWFANEIDTKTNRAAFSVSRYNYDFASDNWMITPLIHLESENACLKWDAKSVYYDYRETYKVMISTSTKDLNSFKEIATIEKESYRWKTHVVSLADYVHQDVYIAFVCISKNQFILAIDNLFVGELSEVSFDIKDESKRFSGDIGIAPVKGRIRNTGKVVELKGINCITPQDTYIWACDNLLFRPGEELAFDFQIPISLNEVSHYKLVAETTDEGVFDLHEDSIICSYYPRTLLVEKATANWCNICPSGNLVSNALKDRFGEEAIIIEVHSSDPYSCAPYITGITRWLQAYPSFIYNRNSSYIQYSMRDDELIRKALLIPTTAQIKMQVERSQENNALLTLSTETEFAVSYDNASEIYKLGYAVVEKTAQGAAQSNTSTLLSDGEYYYLPYYIPGDTYVYHNVAREGSTAFQGVKNSLPAQINAGGKYGFNYSLAIPDEFADSGNLLVVAFIINTVTGEVLNSTCRDIPAKSTGIGGAKSNTGRKIAVISNGCSSYTISFEDMESAYSLELIGLDGRVVDKQTGMPGTHRITVEYSDYRGCYILRINQRNYSVTKKIFLF